MQALARHAKPQTTLNHYAKVSVRDLRGAVESLPVPPGGIAEAPEALLATDGGRISERLALHLPYGGTVPGEG